MPVMKTELLEIWHKSANRLISTQRNVDVGKWRSRDGHRWASCVCCDVRLAKRELAGKQKLHATGCQYGSTPRGLSGGLGNFCIYIIGCPFVICYCVACDFVPGRGPEAVVGWQTWQSAWGTGSGEGLLEVDQMALLVFNYGSSTSTSSLCLKSCSHQLDSYGKENLGSAMACPKQETRCGVREHSDWLHDSYRSCSVTRKGLCKKQ